MPVIACELKNYGASVVYKNMFYFPDYAHVLSAHVCSDIFIQPRSEVNYGLCIIWSDVGKERKLI